MKTIRLQIDLLENEPLNWAVAQAIVEPGAEAYLDDRRVKIRRRLGVYEDAFRFSPATTHDFWSELVLRGEFRLQYPSHTNGVEAAPAKGGVSSAGTDARQAVLRCYAKNILGPYAEIPAELCEQPRLESTATTEGRVSAHTRQREIGSHALAVERLFQTPEQNLTSQNERKRSRTSGPSVG